MAAFTLAVQGDEPIEGVICPFEARWQDSIHSGTTTVVFRKRGLARGTPRWLYVYIGAPISAITARLPVQRAESLPLKEAMALCKEGDISEDSLEEYAQGKEELFVFTLGQVQLAKTQLSSAMLKSEYDFFPSPNLIRLSEEGTQTLNQRAGFSK